MRHFRTQNGPFASSTAFLGMTINTIFIYLLPHIYCPNFKKNFYADPGFWCTILGSKMTHLLKQEFLSENPLKSIVPLIHAYLLKVRYQSINKMLMIKEYWNLIGRDPLVLGKFWFFLPNELFFFFEKIRLGHSQLYMGP